MRYLIIIAIIVFTTSCSVKKRNYRKGYHIDWAFNKKRSETKTTQPESSGKLTDKKEFPKKLDQNTEINIVTASADKGIDQIQLPKQQNLIFPGDTCGDQLFFKSGDIIVGKVIEISEDKIKYKRCDNLSGPQFIVSKSSVQSIKYANGITENIVPDPNYTPYEKKPDPRTENLGPRKVHPKAIWALVLLILGLVMPAQQGILVLLALASLIISLILSLKAIKEIKTNPKIYKGMILAKVVKTLGIIILGLLALALVIIVIAVLSGI